MEPKKELHNWRIEYTVNGVKDFGMVVAETLEKAEDFARKQSSKPIEIISTEKW